MVCQELKACPWEYVPAKLEKINKNRNVLATNSFRIIRSMPKDENNLLFGYMYLANRICFHFCILPPILHCNHFQESSLGLHNHISVWLELLLDLMEF